MENKTKSKTKKPIKSGAFSVCLSVNGEEYKTTGDDLMECVEKLKKPDWGVFKSKSTFTVKHKGLTAQKTLNIPQMRRLYGNDTAKSIFVKNLKMVLKYE